MLFEEAFDVMKFPAGEPHVRVRSVAYGAHTIFCNNVRNFDDLLCVITGAEILKRNGHHVEWVIPYFPFARQDRRIDAADGEELLIAIGLVRGIDPVIYDPHSELSATLRHITQAQIVDHFIEYGLFDTDKHGDDIVVAIPDAGATKKAYSWLGNIPYVQCLKRRDPATGKLSGFQVIENDLVDLGGKTVVIVDDICDGGGTFLGLAQELYQNHDILDMRLAVTHGLFTKGLDQLLVEFEKIYTLDTCKLQSQRLIKVPTQGIHTENTPI